MAARVLALAAAAVLLLSGAAALDAGCFTSAGVVLATPASPNWTGDRSVYNEKIDVQPAAVAYAHSEAEVAAAIKCAQAQGLGISPRGGGHGYEGYAVQTGKLVLDVTNLTDFTNNGDGTATFGSGLRLGAVYLNMYEKANSLFSAGLCPWVGAVGHILGGGTGMATRKYGLACDSVTELRMVDAAGAVVVANARQNAGLFWASCGGGGGNLGVVTSFTVRLQPLDAIPAVTTIYLQWSGYGQAVDVFDSVQRWVPGADTKLGLQILIGFGSTSINAQWLGPRSEAQAALDASGILSIPGLTTNELQEMSWINATLHFAHGTQNIPTNGIWDLNMSAGLPPGVQDSFTAGSSYNQQPMSREGIQAMVAAVQAAGDNNAFVEHKMLGGGEAQVGPTDTAFFYRSALFETQWFYHWPSGNSQEAASKQWLGTTLATMKPYVGQGAYINYPDPLLAASNSWPTDYFGGNLQRLAQVKAQYDPTNYFNNPLTVAPAGGGQAPSLAPGSAPAQPQQAAPAPVSAYPSLATPQGPRAQVAAVSVSG